MGWFGGGSGSSSTPPSKVSIVTEYKPEEKLNNILKIYHQNLKIQNQYLKDKPH